MKKIYNIESIANSPIYITCSLGLSLLNPIFTLVFYGTSLYSIVKTNSKKITPYISIGILLVINLYASHLETQRYAFMDSIPNQNNASFSGHIQYLHKSKLILSQPNNTTLTVFLPPKKTAQLSIGDFITIHGRYVKPEKKRNPGQSNSRRYAMMHKKLGIVYASNLTKKETTKKNLYLKFCTKIKKKIVEQHKKSLPEPHSTLYTALLFGESYAELSQELKECFKKAGLIHALVVSGSQVSLVIGIIILFLNAIGIYRSYQFIIIIPTCLVFYTITGGGESVARAMIMANLILVCKYVLNYKTSPIYIINLTALIMLLWDPFIIHKPGALLSFLATFSLIYGIDTLSKALPSVWPSLLKTLIASCLAPWMFTTPLLILYFNQLPIASIISNFLLTGLIEYIVILGFISTCIGFIYFPLALIINQVAYLGITIILKVSQVSTQLPFAIINTAFPIITCLSLIIAAVVFVNTSLSTSKKITITSLLFFGTFVLPKIISQKNTFVTFLDIGQGDAAIIRHQNTSILVDTGPAYDRHLGNINRNVLIPAFNHYGINSLDYLIITHFDKDHSANLAALLKSIPIKTIIHNGNLHAYLNNQNITLPQSTQAKKLCQNQTLEIGTLSLKFLNPCSNTQSLNKNNQSLVFQVQKNNHKLLFTGDIEKESEEILLETVPHKLSTTVLKVPHHGSNTSSTELFLRYSNAKFAIISAGQNNRYKHPKPTIINRLKQHGSQIYRTDTHGAIHIKLNQKLSIHPFI